MLRLDLRTLGVAGESLVISENRMIASEVGESPVLPGTRLLEAVGDKFGAGEGCSLG